MAQLTRRKTRPRRTPTGGKRRRGGRGKRATGAMGRLVRQLADAGFYLFALAIAAAAIAVQLTRDLPDTDGLWKANATPRVTLVAADGSPIAVHGQNHGAPVRLAELPRHVSLAVLAVEDRNFYGHVGVNPLSLIRALVINARD
jgi:penicillin-binding protein 1A